MKRKRLIFSSLQKKEQKYFEGKRPGIRFDSAKQFFFKNAHTASCVELQVVHKVFLAKVDGGEKVKSGV